MELNLKNKPIVIILSMSLLLLMRDNMSQPLHYGWKSQDSTKEEEQVISNSYVSISYSHSWLCSVILYVML